MPSCQLQNAKADAVCARGWTPQHRRRPCRSTASAARPMESTRQPCAASSPLHTARRHGLGPLIVGAVQLLPCFTRFEFSDRSFGAACATHGTQWPVQPAAQPQRRGRRKRSFVFMVTAQGPPLYCGIPSGPGTVGGRAHLGLHCEEATSGLGRGGEAPGDTPLGHGNGRVMPVPPPANGQCTQKANSPATAQVREFRSVKRCTRESFAPHHHQRAPSTCWHRTAGCCLHGNHDGPCSTQMRSGPRKRGRLTRHLMTPEGGEWNDATDWSSATPAPLMNTPLRYPIGAYVDYMRPSIVTNKYVVMCKFVCVRVVLLCLCRVGNVSKTDVIYTTAQTEHTHTLSDTQPSPNVQPHTTYFISCCPSTQGPDGAPGV